MVSPSSFLGFSSSAFNYFISFLKFPIEIIKMKLACLLPLFSIVNILSFGLCLSYNSHNELAKHNSKGCLATFKRTSLKMSTPSAVDSIKKKKVLVLGGDG